MPSIFVQDPSGSTRELEIENGLSLMEMLRDAGYEEILAICGGSCSCATCHVHILEDPQLSLSTMEEDEEFLLEMEENFDPQFSRLSCQLEMTENSDGLAVKILDTGM